MEEIVVKCTIMRSIYDQDEISYAIKILYSVTNSGFFLHFTVAHFKQIGLCHWCCLITQMNVAYSCLGYVT